MQTGNVTTPFGRRPMTLAMLATQIESADIESGKSVDKWQVFRALCEARGYFRIGDRALSVLNALLSFYPSNELSEEQGLVVFPSNQQLSIRAHGMAAATLRRHLADLVEAGLITRKDSPNGKRYARKGDNGAISEAFGLSLAPLLARAEEIEAQAEIVRTERLEIRLLRERISLCRRDIAKLIETGMEEGVPARWDAHFLSFRAIVESLGRKAGKHELSDAAETLDMLRDELVNILENHVKSTKSSANESHSERHIQNSKTNSHPESEPRLEKARAENPEEPGSIVRLETKAFPLAVVLQACPQICDYGPDGSISHWRDLMSAAVVVRSMLGVSPSAYQEAAETMGQENAAIVMACILERAGQIQSAGGYLRGLTTRAERGEFSIGPMVMALLRANGQSARKAG